MPSTFFGLTIGSSGLNAANIALNTTLHNIANIETDGYSRQQVEATADNALRVYSSYGMAGSGVAVIDVKQVRDSYYDYKYWNNNKITGEYTVKRQYGKEIEDLYFNELTDAGFTTYYGKFCNALDAFSSTPSEQSIRNQVIMSGQSLADYFNNVAENLEQYQDEVNTNIKMVIDRVNTISSNIASLNGQISVLEMNGGTANDLRDKRNTLVDELSGLVGITVKETVSPTGSSYYDIKINNQSLVYGTNYHTLSVQARESSERRHGTDLYGLYDIKWETGLNFDSYNEKLSGELMGYLQIRDGDNLVKPDFPLDANGDKIGQAVDYKGIPYYMEQTNAFLSEYTKQFNTIHMTAGGQDLNGDTTEEVPFFTIKDMSVDEMKQKMDDNEDGFGKYKTTVTVTSADEIMAKDIENYKRANNIKPGAMSDQDVKDAIMNNGGTVERYDIVSCIADNVTAGNICVNPDLVLHNDMLSSGKSIYSSGVDTPDIAEALKDLRAKKTFRGGMPEEQMQALVSVSSVDSTAAKGMMENHENIGDSIINQRLSIMGVDKEEEAVALVKYQHAFELASKVISVMNELYDKLINQTGL